MTIDKTGAIKKILDLPGVDRFILIDDKGHVADHSFTDPDADAALLRSCADQLFNIGKVDPGYCVFKRKNQEDFFIFPVGNYCLGVIKQKEFETFDLADTILKFLAEL